MSYKSMLIKLSIFTLGGTVGFLVAQQIYKKYYADIAQKEIDSVKETLKNYKPFEVIKSNKTETQEKKTNNNPLVRSSLDGNKYEQIKKNYNLTGIKYKDEDEDEGQEDEELDVDAAGKTEKEMNPDKLDRDLPYIINDQEFSEECDHHDKVSLYYYQLDDVLCDEYEEVIEEIEEKVGYDALSVLDMQTTVWVRNEPLCIDYEIISIKKSFAETVHGIGLEPVLSPRERYLRQKTWRE